jgi:RpiB/LacA/LacB family sugar-phosphate isomerase
MKISLGVDHGAFNLRETLLAHLKDAGHDVIDHGTYSTDSVDYPDYAHAVASDITAGRADLGVLCCTTGIGVSIAANKVDGIRAANVRYEDEAALSRRHNHANVICLGALHTTTYEAKRLVDIFLSAPFEGGRHARRVGKMSPQPTQPV